MQESMCGVPVPFICLYSTAEEGHSDLAKSLPFSFHFISICLSDAHSQARRRYHLS